MKQLEDSKFSKAIDILIGCSVRLGSFLDGRSNIDKASVCIIFRKNAE